VQKRWRLNVGLFVVVGRSIPFHVPSSVSGTAPGYGVAGRQRSGSEHVIANANLCLAVDSLGLTSASSPSRAVAGRRLSLGVTNNGAAGCKGNEYSISKNVR